MSEVVTIEGGRIRVHRVEGKQSTDVAVNDVKRVYFERGIRDGAGALVLVDCNDHQHVIRVDNDDAAEYLALVNRARGAGPDVADLFTMLHEESVTAE